MKTVTAGIIVCAKISGIYMENCNRFEVPNLSLLRISTGNAPRSRQASTNAPNVYSVDEILADPEIELIINLTISSVHADVCLRALESGKHVYVEKPLAVTRERGQAVLETAKRKGLLVVAHQNVFGFSNIVRLPFNWWKKG